MACAFRFSAAAALAFSLSAFVGCSSLSPSKYVSPRVTGRVLDMESKQPLRNVQIRRVTSDSDRRPTQAPTGGQLLENSYAVRTGADGTFDLASMRSLDLFRDYGWYSVTLDFEKAGYQAVVRSFTLSTSTNAPSGEPLVQAGDILLPKMRNER